MDQWGLFRVFLTVFILLVLFVLCRMIYRFVKRFLGSIESPNPIVIKIEQYEEAMAVYSEVQLAAEGRRLEAEQEAQRKELQARRTVERARIEAERERLEAERAAERKRLEAERARQATLRAEQRKHIDYWMSLRGIQFEQELAALYRHLGYQVQSTPKSGDQGIDLILTKDGKTTIVQCKGQKGHASPAVVRELYGSLYAFEGASHAILACTGGFTQGVRDFATGKPITLISTIEMAQMAEKVTRSQRQGRPTPKNSTPTSIPKVQSEKVRQPQPTLTKQASVGVSQTLSCKAEQELQPLPKTTIINRPVDRICSECGSKMTFYKASFAMFWECSKYPECTFSSGYKSFL